MFSRGTAPKAQLGTQEKDCKFKVLQEVQFGAAIEQVAQSPLQATATPEMLTYPTGT
jgi:hypothetical protein